MNVLCFGIAKDIVGSSTVEVERIDSVGNLRKFLISKYPEFSSIKKCMIAVNEEYAEDDLQIKDSDAIAIIPPVSGG